MKLYLSSYKLGDHPEQFAKLFGENKNVGIILNAGDVYGDEKRNDYLTRERESLSQIGLIGHDLDLRDYFNQPDALQSKLNEFGGIWVLGGNSFALLRAMHASGFNVVAKEKILHNSLVYGGFSAGAVVATPSLRGIEIVDDPDVVPEGYPSETLWDGLGLVDYSIAPHHQSDHPESPLIENVVRFFQENDMPYKALRDGEVIIVSE